MYTAILGNTKDFDALVVTTNRFSLVQLRNCMPKVIFPATPKVIAVTVPEIMIILNTIGACLLFVLYACGFIPVFEGDKITVGPCHVEPSIIIIQAIDIWVILISLEVSSYQRIFTGSTTVGVENFRTKSSPLG